MTADVLEAAADITDRERAAVIDRQQGLSELQTRLARAREEQRGAGPAWCIDCDEQLTAARREAVPGCLRCTSCEDEHSRRQHGKR